MVTDKSMINSLIMSINVLIIKWPTGSGKVSNPRLLGALINFREAIKKKTYEILDIVQNSETPPP